MLCEKCGNKPAVEKIEIINTNHEKKTQYLCEDCAGKLAGTLLSFDGWNPFSALYAMSAAAPLTTRTEACPSCGLTYSGFLKQGRFGCVHCYEAFGDRLDPLFRKLHFSSEYKGKVPQDIGVHLKTEESPLEKLKRELKEAVAAENYEAAAELKKQIDRFGEDQPQ